MNPHETISCHCPYCGEALELTVDCTVGRQRYIEDCQVCCRPMVVSVAVDRDGVPAVDVGREDD